MITVDSRGCGLGKTTNTTNGIYSLLYKHKFNNERAVIVVPSIELMKQYVNQTNLNIVMVNSDIHENTSYELLNLFRNNTQFIIITHETFVKINNYGYLCNYHLIIDEALENIFRVTKIFKIANKYWKPNLRFNELYVPYDEYNVTLLRITPNNDTENWIKMRCVDDNKFMFNDSTIFKNMTHVNYNLYLTHNDWEILNSETGESNGVLISELSTDILNNWISVHISSSHFETTMMCYWLRNNNIEYKIIREFQKHDGDITLHVPDIKWSKYKLNNHSDIHKHYVNYVNNTATDSVLCVRNNNMNDNLLFNEIRLTHNVHGMNNYTQYNNISLESALVPHPIFSNFLIKMYGMDKKQIIRAYSTYKFYQIIMRSSLRTNSTNPVHIFMLDMENATLLFDYINIKKYVDMEIKYESLDLRIKYLTPEEKKLARQEKNKEYQRRHREKKKINSKIGVQ